MTEMGLPGMGRTGLARDGGVWLGERENMFLQADPLPGSLTTTPFTSPAVDYILAVEKQRHFIYGIAKTFEEGEQLHLAPLRGP